MPGMRAVTAALMHDHAITRTCVPTHMVAHICAVESSLRQYTQVYTLGQRCKRPRAEAKILVMPLPSVQPTRLQLACVLRRPAGQLLGATETSPNQVTRQLLLQMLAASSTSG